MSKPVDATESPSGSRAVKRASLTDNELRATLWAGGEPCPAQPMLGGLHNLEHACERRVHSSQGAQRLCRARQWTEKYPMLDQHNRYRKNELKRLAPRSSPMRPTIRSNSGYISPHQRHVIAIARTFSLCKIVQGGTGTLSTWNDRCGANNHMPADRLIFTVRRVVIFAPAHIVDSKFAHQHGAS